MQQTQVGAGAGAGAAASLLYGALRCRQLHVMGCIVVDCCSQNASAPYHLPCTVPYAPPAAVEAKEAMAEATQVYGASFDVQPAAEVSAAE